MKAIRLPSQSAEQMEALEQLYRKSKDGRLIPNPFDKTVYFRAHTWVRPYQNYTVLRDRIGIRLRAHIILLAAEQGMVAPQIAAIVRLNEESVRKWLKWYQAEGIEGPKDNLPPGMEPTVTEEFRAKLVSAVRRRPRSLGLPFSMWTLQRLADYLAEETGLRVSYETVRRYLALEGIVMSRPQHKVNSPDPEYEVKKRRSKRPATG